MSSPTTAEILANRTLFNELFGPDIIKDANDIIGPTFLMLPIDALCFGVMICQVFTFAENWRVEHWATTACVAIIACFEVITTSWLWYWGWEVNVTHYGSIYEFVLSKYVWPLVFMTSVVSFVAQMFYSRKAWILWNKKWYVLAACSLTAIYTFASSMGLMYSFVVIDVMYDHSHIGIERLFTYQSYFGAIICDIVITTFIFIKLLQSRTGWKGTNQLIYRLIMISCEAQLPPSLCAFAVAISVIVQGSNTILSQPWLCISGKVYGMCFLFSLNSRQALKKNTSGSSSGGQGGLQSRGGKSFGKSNGYADGSRSVPGHVLVDVEQIQVADNSNYMPDLGSTRRQPRLQVQEEDMEMTPYAAAPLTTNSIDDEETVKESDSKEDLRNESQASFVMLVDKDVEAQGQRARRVNW